MGLFVCDDDFSLDLPGTIERMSAGIMGPFGPATGGVLVGAALLMAVPAPMIPLSVILPPLRSRWANVAAGGLFTLVNALTLIGAPPFYAMVVVLEIALSL